MIFAVTVSPASGRLLKRHRADAFDLVVRNRLPCKFPPCAGAHRRSRGECAPDRRWQFNVRSASEFGRRDTKKEWQPTGFGSRALEIVDRQFLETHRTLGLNARVTGLGRDLPRDASPLSVSKGSDSGQAKDQNGGWGHESWVYPLM